TSLDRLWAAGEVASSGAHGANRLASNSLLEAVVYAARIAHDLSGLTSRPAAPWRAADERADAADCEPSDAPALRRLMANDVGVIRNRPGLRRALARLAR